MNLVTLFESDFLKNKKDHVHINGRRHHHIKEIHRVSVGDELKVGLINGKIGVGRVTELNDTDLEMDIHLSENPPEPLPLTLILALPRPIVLQRVIQTVTAMGIKNIFLIHSSRVEKSYWHSPVLSEEKLTKNCILGLEQARDTIMPQVHLRQKFKPFLEDEVPGLIGNSLPVVAHPEGTQPCPSAVNTAVTLAIGPEGGFIDYEIEKFRSLGFQIAHLGPRILKVETAIAMLVSKLF
ncbi:MAG: 16S rRNA (uracil(1498)-N(3))-methyltransferase [Candidatus Omnitrophica bacterium]|nr:16S rRNA (uracil(1498)-N(3))-methyltransferase [Candidatus Omnitrophota bacterium]